MLTFLCICGAIALLWPRCVKQTPERAGTTAQSTFLIPFTPPPDSFILDERMNAWFACHRGLDSLAIRFSDLLSNGSSITQDPVRNRYTRMQDTVCAAVGLSGGYAEYQWITGHIGLSKNRQRYDSLRVARGKATETVRQ